MTPPFRRLTRRRARCSSSASTIGRGDAAVRDPIARLAASCELAPEALSTTVDAERVRLNNDGAMATFDGASAKESLNLQNNLNVNLGAHAE